MAITKQWGLAQLRHNRTTFVLALGAQVLLDSAAVQMLRGQSAYCARSGVALGPPGMPPPGSGIEVNLTQIADAYSNDHANHAVSLSEHFKAFRRNLFKESFEVVMGVMEEQGKLPELEAEDWYPYSWVIRNAVSHKLHYDFRKKTLKMLPTTWAGITIDASMNGGVMIESHLPPDVLLGLFIKWEEYVHAH